MNISELSIRRPVLASVLTIIILLFGLIGYSYLGVREFPSVDNPIISVSCSYPGANADVIENQITEPLEQNINGIPGIRSLSSVSSQGQSRITVEFELSVDLETAANDVRDKVSRAQRYLPRDCDPPTVTKADADASPILMVTIQSDKRSLLELSEIADLTVKEQLQTISDVSGVQIWGEKRYSMRLWLDPAKMAGYGITPTDIKTALDRENVELPSGSIEGNTTELTIRTMGLMHTTREFNDLVVREDADRIIRMSDVELTPVEWLWKPYLPFGKLSVLQGNPGEGKTYFAMHLAAACTNGKLLPNMERMEPFNVIYQTAEDGLGDTVKPRLIEAGADLDRVLVIDDSDVQLTLSDERIEKAIIENNARLVIIDPIQAYLGANVDMNRANEVRPIFMRLGQVAQRTGCAILLIGHLNKAAGMQSLQRGLGSIDIAAAVRSVMFIGKLKHDPTMRILTHEKSSLAPPGASLAFSLGDEGGFRWVGEYDITADEMLSGIEPQRETKTQQAKDLICTLLAGGKRVFSEDIDKAALERGIPGRTVRDAKRELGDALKSKIVEGRKKVFWME